MSNQHRLGHDGAKPPGSSKPEDDDDYMQKKCKDVAHSRDGIKPENPKNAAYQGNSPPTPKTSTFIGGMQKFTKLPWTWKSAQKVHTRESDL